VQILVLIGLYFLKRTKFDQLILRKIIKTVATRCQILMLKCTKIDFGCSASDPTGGAYSAPPDPLAGFKGPTSKGKGKGEVKRGGEGRKGKGRGGEGKKEGRGGGLRRERRSATSHFTIYPLHRAISQYCDGQEGKGREGGGLVRERRSATSHFTI